MADSIVGSDAVENEPTEFDALVGISWLFSSSLDDIVAGLESALRQVGLPLPSFQQKLAFIESSVSASLAEASIATDFETARPALKMADRLSSVAGRLALKNDLSISSKLFRLTNDLGHSYDEAILVGIYNDLRDKHGQPA